MNIRLILMVIAMSVFFTGCWCSKPDRIIVPEIVNKPIPVSEELTAIVVLDNTILDNIDDTSKASITLGFKKYAVYLQSVVEKYENRMNSIREWSSEVASKITKDNKRIQ